MMKVSLPAVVLSTALMGVSCSFSDRPSADADDNLPVVQPNDNREPAGSLADGVLTVRLAVRLARWYPEADGGPSIVAPVFTEEGKAPSVPGPLIRAPEGTTIDVTIRNELTDSTLTIHGLQSRPGSADDSVSIAPGTTHEFRFEAGAPGTYMYLARPGAIDYDHYEHEQLAGALIVDPASGAEPDRVLVINIFGEQVDSATYRNTLTINGKAFPYNELLTATVGEAERWRVVNASNREHPMHLHGFFYRVDSRGDLLADTIYSERERREVNWLFHCHLAFHVVPEWARLDPPDAEHDAMSGEVGRHMSGLVMAISVSAPPGWTPPPHENPRQLRLFVQEGPPRDPIDRSMGYVLQRGAMPPAPDSVVLPGTPIILTQGEPTDITVINRMAEATGVHWHGLELESWSDGVAGWSGAGDRIAIPIAPGDSFTARLTLRRPGTFIYHTHLNDLAQLTSGLYGPLIVLPPGQSLDARTDHTFLVGWHSPADPPILAVNGDFGSSAPLEIEAGIPHRFRLINMGLAIPWKFSIQQDSAPVTWRALAKDGADLPPH